MAREFSAITTLARSGGPPAAGLSTVPDWSENAAVEQTK